MREKHPVSIEGYGRDMPQLAEDIGNLRYNALAELLANVSAKIRRDAVEDKKRGRNQLAEELFECSGAIERAGEHIQNAWEISKPYMETV